MMSKRNEMMLDELVGQLTPVRPRSPRRDLAVIALFGAVEIALYVAVRGMRPDMHMAMGLMAFWWKVASLAVLAVIGVVTTIAALDPARSPRRGLQGFAIAAALAIAVGWGLDAAQAGPAALLARLDWRKGVECLGAVVVLSLPALAALAVLMRRGAPTDPGGSVTAAGLAAAAWGGAVFTLACPRDDPFYVAVWFAAAILVVLVIARLLLPRLTRW